MANFDKIINSITPGQVPPGQVPPGQVPPGQVPPEQVPPGQVPPGQVPPEQVPPEQVPPEQPKIDLSKMFDTMVISELLAGIVDFIAVNGLLIYAKKSNVKIDKTELQLPKNEIVKNAEHLNRIIEKTQIPEKSIGSLLIVLTLILSYSEPFKKIKQKKKAKKTEAKQNNLIAKNKTKDNAENTTEKKQESANERIKQIINREKKTGRTTPKNTNTTGGKHPNINK